MSFDELTILIEHYAGIIAKGNLSYHDLRRYLSLIQTYSNQLQKAWDNRR